MSIQNPRFKILFSIFKKKTKRPFNVFVFDYLNKKALYDKEYFGFRDRNYGKKNAHNIKPKTSWFYNEPIIKSISSIKKAITLTYYLKEEE